MSESGHCGDMIIHNNKKHQMQTITYTNVETGVEVLKKYPKNWTFWRYMVDVNGSILEAKVVKERSTLENQKKIHYTLCNFVDNVEGSIINIYPAPEAMISVLKSLNIFETELDIIRLTEVNFESKVTNCTVNVGGQDRIAKVVEQAWKI
jgi:hypothetical protein